MSSSNETFDFRSLTKTEIKVLLDKLKIPLTPEEVLKIQEEWLGRSPTLAELVLFSIEGSEHCSYKSSRNHLKRFVTKGPNVILGAKEDAGIVAVATDNQGGRWCIAISHESHNHPSQIVPYEGAATGVGGNVRDVLCMGARVVAVSDSFRFGDIESHRTKWIHEGVVAGIADYGNPLGIPNLGGDVYYNSGYNDNCLVTVVTLGILNEQDLIHSSVPAGGENYNLILVGKPTDNSGFGGASFASLELEEEQKEQNKGAVQEPNAFLERHLLKASYALMDILKETGWLNRVGFKDLGAGGVACASVELAESAGYGCEVWLDRVHKGMENLHPFIYLCSETQERFMWVAPEEITALIVDHYNKTFDLPSVSPGAKATVIGKIRSDGQYIVKSNGEEIVHAPAKYVTRGFSYDRPTRPRNPVKSEPEIPEPENYNHVFLQLLSHENIASREPIFETYDKQVQGRTLLEPGEADAGILTPFNSTKYPEEIRHTGVAIATDHNPRYGRIDPYWCGVNAVVESMRNVVSVGATPWAISDCLCFGNPEKEHQMWEFVQSVRGVADACQILTLKDFPDAPTPIVAGNVSFYNETKNGAIPPSPIICCIGKLTDARKAITMNFQREGSSLLLVGPRKDECGGSVYYALSQLLGSQLPKPDLKETRQQIWAVEESINRRLVLSCHDISDGGLSVALAEMSFKNGIGCEVTTHSSLRTDKHLFSETGGFIMEVMPDKIPDVRRVFHRFSTEFEIIGKTTNHQVLNINEVIRIPIRKAREVWKNGLRTKLI